jgi:hypothetical protein
VLATNAKKNQKKSTKVYKFNLLENKTICLYKLTCHLNVKNDSVAVTSYCYFKYNEFVTSRKVTSYVANCYSITVHFINGGHPKELYKTRVKKASIFAVN